MKVESGHLYYSEPHFYEFCFPRLDTLVRVEETEDQVVIRATRDTFSEQRKRCFLRELVAEGFISDCYQWSTGFNSLSWPRIRWFVDFSWLEPTGHTGKRAHRFMIGLLASTVLLWLLLMTLLFLR